MDVLVVLVCGARDRYFCFISSVVKGAPVLRIPEPVELSELVLDSDEALRPPGACTSVDVRLLFVFFFSNTNLIIALVKLPRTWII